MNLVVTVVLVDVKRTKEEIREAVERWALDSAAGARYDIRPLPAELRQEP